MNSKINYLNVFIVLFCATATALSFLVYDDYFRYYILPPCVVCLAPIFYKLFITNKHEKIDFFAPEIFIPIVYLLFLVLGTSIYYVRCYYSEKTLKLIARFYLYGICAYYVGIFLVNRISTVRTFDKNFDKPKFEFYLKSLITINIFAVLFFLFKVKNLPMFMSNTNLARMSVVHSVSGYVMKCVSLGFFVTPLFSAYILKFQTKYNKLYIIYLCFSILILLGLAWRGALLGMVLMLIVNYHYLSNRLSIKKLFIMAITLLSLVLLIKNFRSSITYNLFHLSDLFLPFQVDTQNLIRIVSNIPNLMDYQFGKTLLLPLKMILPGDDDNLGQILKNLFSMKFEGGGITATIIGEFYINFGKFCPWLGMLLLGSFLQYLYLRMIHINCKKENFLDPFMYSLMLYYSALAIKRGMFVDPMPFLYFSLIYLIRLKVYHRSKEHPTSY